MFCAVGRMSGMRGLVAYPLALFYVGFGKSGQKNISVWWGGIMFTNPRNRNYGHLFE